MSAGNLQLLRKIEPENTSWHEGCPALRNRILIVGNRDRVGQMLADSPDCEEYQITTVGSPDIDRMVQGRFDVIVSGCSPRTPTQSFRSSTAMNNTFGRSAA